MTSLLEIFNKHPSVTIDSRNIREGQIFFAIKGDHFDGHEFIPKAFELGASYCVSSDSSFALHPAVIMVEDTLIALQQLAKDYRNTFDIPFFGITGSNGKTTTKELMAHVMSTKYKTHMTKGNLNNHLGVPLTILSTPPDSEFAIIEMGANHIGEIRDLCEIARPTHGLITNIGIAHLEGFGSPEGVRIAKSELMHYLAEHGGVQFLNSEESSLAFLMENGYSKQIIFGKDQNSSLNINENHGMNLSLAYEGNLYETKLFGQYNYNNVLAAFEVGKYFECDPMEMIEAIINYTPTNNRSQRYEFDGVTMIMDAYNANPSSVHNAVLNIASMSEAYKSIILGDMLELGDLSGKLHRQVLTELSETSDWSIVILIGSVFYQYRDEFTSFRFYETTEDAAAQLDWAQFRGHVVLLKGSRGLKLESLVPHPIQP